MRGAYKRKKSTKLLVTTNQQNKLFPLIQALSIHDHPILRNNFNDAAYRFNTVDDDTSNFFMVAICRPGLIGGEAAASHHTSTAQTHTPPQSTGREVQRSGDKQR
jgi:hypothetical protein